MSIGFGVAGAILGGSPELHTVWRVDGVSIGFGVSCAIFGGSLKLQRTGWVDGVRVDLAWQAPYSEAVRSSTQYGWLMVREWVWRAGHLVGGSLELHRTGWADGVRVDLAWQAPYSEAVRSSRRQVGLMV